MERADLTIYSGWLHLPARILSIDHLNGGTAAIAMSNLGNLKRDEKQYARAEQLNRKALAAVGQALPPDHLYTGVILLVLGKT